MSINIQEVTKVSVEKTYPRFVIDEISDNVSVGAALSQTIKNLEPGNCQLQLTYKGQEKVIRNISNSPINVEWLLRIIPHLTYETTETIKFNIVNIESYLEVL